MYAVPFVNELNWYDLAVDASEGLVSTTVVGALVL